MKSLTLTTVLVLGASVANAAFNYSNVALATRRVWCRAQVAQCPALCADNQKSAITNECYPDNLYYACVCSDGLKPNVTEYSETIPWYLCTGEQQSCITDCGPGANSCADQCRKTWVCGATHPKQYNATEMASATATDGAAATGSSDSGSGFASSDGESADTSKSEATALKYGSFGVVVAGMVAGAALVGF